jgi:hypothetical protein
MSKPESKPESDPYNEIYMMSAKLVKKYKDQSCSDLLDALCSILGEYGDVPVGPWNPDILPGGDLYGIFTNKILDLPEKIIKGNGETTIVFKNHIMMQVFRIPCLEPPTLYNLLSIALYCGLLTAAKSSDFPEGIIKTFNILKVSGLVNFVSRTTFIEAINKIPTDVIRDISIRLLSHRRQT